MEHRLNERLRFRALVTVSPAVPGPQVEWTGNAITYSVYGMLIELPCSIPTGAMVIVDIPGHDVAAKAFVRHSRPAGSWFRIGLEFVVPLLTGCANSQSILLVKPGNPAIEEED